VNVEIAVYVEFVEDNYMYFCVYVGDSYFSTIRLSRILPFTAVFFQHFCNGKSWSLLYILPWCIIGLNFMYTLHAHRHKLLRSQMCFSLNMSSLVLHDAVWRIAVIPNTVTSSTDTKVSPVKNTKICVHPFTMFNVVI
jgi:hypothetical protein